jgi:hypothetical protein
MKHSKLALVVLTFGTLLSTGLLTGFAQERTKPKTPATVPEILARAGTSFGEGRFSACLTDIREATALVSAERAKLIRAALPAAQKGMEKSAVDDTAAMGGFAAAFASTVGTMVNQDYTSDSKSIGVVVTIDSPMGQVFGMMIANPAMLEPGSELIKYGAHKGVLKGSGDRSFELQIMLESTMVAVNSSGLTDDELLAFMDQKAVDALVAALSK